MPSKTTSPYQVGKILGNYQLLMPVSEGRLGAIWAARPWGDFSFRRLVAVKVASSVVLDNPEVEEAFVEEAHVASAVHHPHLRAVQQLGEDGKSLFIVMEWINGGSLHDVLERVPDGVLSPRVAARIVANACAGLHVAHEALTDDGEPSNVVHGDLSPFNVLLVDSGHTKVTGLGGARARNALQKIGLGDLPAIAAGPYTPPEVLLGKDIDRRADVYSMGRILSRCVRRVSMGDDARLSRSSPMVGQPRGEDEIPEGLRAIFDRASAARPEDRFPSAEAMRLALEGWLASTGGLVTERDIADVVRNTVASTIDARSASIRQTIERLDAGKPKGGVMAQVSLVPKGGESLRAERRGNPEEETQLEVVDAAPDGRLRMRAIVARAPFAWLSIFTFAVFYAAGCLLGAVVPSPRGASTVAPDTSGKTSSAGR